MAEPLSICMVTTFYPPLHFGGDAAYAYQLTNALARRGHAVTVVHSADAYRTLGGKHAGDFAHAPGVTVRRLKTRLPTGSSVATYLTGRPLVYGRQLREVLDGGRFDVIHFHNVSLAGGPGVLEYGDAVKLYTTSEHWLVCPMHVLFRYNREPCVEPHCLRCTLAFRRPPQLWRYTGLLDRSVKHVDLFLSPSRFTLEAHRARGFTAPMRHLPYFHAAEPQVTSCYKGDTRPYFLYVGRLERLKGVQVLIDVFRDYRHADLLIVGEGTMGAELRRQAEGLDHVRFLGRLHPSELGPFYEGAVALLVPSIGYEVFGIVALEAFARRTPAIAHDLGALTEVIEDSNGGLLYRTTAELRAAMDRFLGDEGLRRELGDRGHDAWRRLWSEDVHVGRYYEAIEEARGARDVRAVILTYHAIEAGPKPLCIEPALFRDHAVTIAASGATCLTVRELGAALRAGELPERAVAITFDDGCESVVTNAAPVLAEHGLRATVFCVAGHLGKTNDWPGQRASAHPLRLASAEQLAELVADGFEVGSHGTTHAALADVTSATAAREIDDSKTVLEAAAGTTVTSFAWPYGARPEAEAARRIAATYDAACSTALARVTPDTDALALPRIDAHYLRRPERLRTVLEGARDDYLRLRAIAARARRVFRKDYE